MDNGFNRVFFQKDLTPADMPGQGVKHSRELRVKGSKG